MYLEKILNENGLNNDVINLIFEFVKYKEIYINNSLYFINPEQYI